MAMVLVGATIVGSIGTIWQGDLQRSSVIRQYPCDNYTLAEKTLAQGDEMAISSWVQPLYCYFQKV